MYDYKFRQSDLSFKKSRRSAPKLLFRVLALAVAAGAVYGVVQLGFYFMDDAALEDTNSDIIPLQIPSRGQHQGGLQPEDSRGESPGEALSNQRPVENSLVQAGPRPEMASANGAVPLDRKRQETPADGESGTLIVHEVKPGESLASIFQDNDLSPQLLQSILRSGREAKHLERIRPNDKLRIYLDRKRQFAELQLQLDKLRSVRFSATDRGIQCAKIRKPTQLKANAASNVIESSLFSSAARVGLPDAITMQMAKIFGWDIDFALEIRPGDRFTVIYEEKWSEGERVGAGEIVAAEFVNQGRSHRAIRFTDSRGKTDYYSPQGRPLKKTFFRTPVNFTRISSRFSTSRWHPVLKRPRAHRGVDYAAPSGTPIIATGDAIVEFRGWKKGYGRVVYLRHGPKYRTVYGHMSRFAKGLGKGDRVKQGEVIGYVGKSGLATGPHLHYEFHVNGVHRNPLTVKAPMYEPLSPREMERFRDLASPLLASLEQTAGDRMLAAAR